MVRSEKEFRPLPYAAGCAALAAILLMAGCGGSLYKVKPVVEAPVAGAAASAGAGGISFRAVPLLTDEESQELFEANLPLSGLLPVRVELGNEGSAPVALERARFRLRDSTGREWKARSAKQAVSRILDANAVTLYNPNARARFEEAVSAYALDTKTPLAPAEHRRGMIFFQTPKKEPVESPRSLTITVERLPQPIELHLN
ncbi:MAG: hypothetical protein WCF57_01850 [Pyrinomonadaceae bacterium]